MSKNEQFIEAVKSNLSYAGVLRELGLKPAGSNYDTVKRKIKELNLDTSHMTEKAWNQGKRFTPVKEHKCECCGRTEWLGKPIVLELHHINGIKDDLRLENLQILCPNCHSFTDNYRGKALSTQKETFDVNVG